MRKNKDDRYYANLLLREVDKLLDFAFRVDFSDPERNEEAIYVMNFCIVQIKENMGFLTSDFQRNKLGIRVGQFSDFRNLLVHEYGQADYSAYQDLVEKDMVKLKKNLEIFWGKIERFSLLTLLPSSFICCHYWVTCFYPFLGFRTYRLHG